MKVTKVFFAATTLVGLNLLAVQVRAQTTPTTTYIPATTIVGSHVTGPEGDQVGAITNVILDRQTGCMAYVVVSTQGAGARKAVAVPWSVFSPGSDTHTYTVRVAREKIDNAPVWEASNLEEYNRGDWIGNLYAYYGVQSGGADMADIRSASADREERRRQRREQRMERNPADHYRKADVRMERERGRRGMRERPAAEPTATPTASESPTPQPGTPVPSPSSNPGSQPHEGASITPSATPSATRNPDELRPPPAGEGPTASPKPGS
jgi:sporulation protein YlmC with PRC-barrel domain